MAGVDINEFPKILTTFPQENSHCIIAKDKYGDSTLLPLSLQGITSVLNAFKITEA